MLNREPGISDALERAVEAGQSLMVRRMELLAAEARSWVQSGGSVLLAGLFGLIGWIYLMNGVTDGLSTRLPRFAVELGVGLAHLSGALAFWWWRKPR